MVTIIVRYLVAFIIVGSLAASSAHACSPLPDVTLFKYFSEHAKVFYGTVKGKSSQKDVPENTFDVVVNETFKGLPEKGKWGGIIAVTFNVNGQCGLGVPENGAQILVFMNDGDLISSTSGSRLVWQEGAKAAPFVNPTMDDVVLLRHFVKPLPPLGVVPDEATAIHLALKVLLPVYGKEEVQKNWPFKVSRAPQNPKGYDGVDWIVSAGRICSKGSLGCRAVWNVEINQWTGDVQRVRSGV